MQLDIDNSFPFVSGRLLILLKSPSWEVRFLEKKSGNYIEIQFASLAIVERE